MTDFHDIEAIIASRQKILAIKEFRARTGAGLKDAKDAVEWFEAHGEWPAAYRTGAALASELVPPPQASIRQDPLRAIEQLVAEGQLIGAIKEVRALTGWGLKECKDAVEGYRDQRRWPEALVVAIEGKSVAPVAAPAPVVAPAPAPAPVYTPVGGSSQSASASLRNTLAEHLGHAPDIQLAVRADRSSGEGYLVMLRDRACFVHTDERWGVDPDFAYGEVNHVESVPGTPAVLYVSVGRTRERFTLAEAEAEAVLALFRVFAP